MSDERTERTPEEIAAGIEERKAREREKMWRARQRLIGSTLVGAFAFGKVVTVPAATDGGVLGLGVSGPEVFWIGVLLLAFGIASFDQLLRALGRG